MKDRKHIFVSDFDGTLTLRDSMFEFLVYSRGKRWLAFSLLRLAPLLVLMKLGFYSNQRAKERLLYMAFGDTPRRDFDALVRGFVADARPRIMRHDLLDRLQTEASQGSEVIVVTASPRVWVEMFVPEFKVLGTEMDFTERGFSGRFSTPNCYGQEKVDRLTAYIPEIAASRSAFHITAYGDSRGDRELLAFADEGHLIR